jgi:hypothetical protein
MKNNLSEKEDNFHNISSLIYTLPNDLIDKFFNKNKDKIFVTFLSKQQRENRKIQDGMHLYISDDNWMLYGESVVINIEELNVEEIIKKYKTSLIYSPEKLIEASKNTNNEKSYVFHLKDIKKYTTPKKASYFNKY